MNLTKVYYTETEVTEMDSPLWSDIQPMQRTSGMSLTTCMVLIWSGQARRYSLPSPFFEGVRPPTKQTRQLRAGCIKEALNVVPRIRRRNAL